MVEGSGLENRRACKRTVGSNPTLSAIFPKISGYDSGLFRSRSSRTVAHLQGLPRHRLSQK